MHNVFVVLVNGKVGSRDAPDEDFQKFDLKHFLNKIKKNESKFGVHPKISFIVVVFTVGAICFSCIRSSIFSDRSGPGSCRTGKCCNLKSSCVAQVFHYRKLGKCAVTQSTGLERNWLYTEVVEHVEYCREP